MTAKDRHNRVLAIALVSAFALTFAGAMGFIYLLYIMAQVKK